MEPKDNSNTKKDNLKEAREEAATILAKLAEEAKTKDFEALKKPRAPQLRIKAKIPVRISPEKKKVLRYPTLDKSAVKLSIDLKQTEESQGELLISERKKKKVKKEVKKGRFKLKVPETPGLLSSPSIKEEGPMKKDLILNKMRKVIEKEKRKKKLLYLHLGMRDAEEFVEYDYYY